MGGLVGLVALELEGGNGEARGQHGLLAQDREFLDHEADIAVEFDKVVDVGVQEQAAAALSDLAHGDEAMQVPAVDLEVVRTEGFLPETAPEATMKSNDPPRAPKERHQTPKGPQEPQ